MIAMFIYLILYPRGKISRIVLTQTKAEIVWILFS